MATNWIELITGSFEGKRRYQRYRAHTKQLPASYRTAVEALERYLNYCGGGDGTGPRSMLEDLLELFELSAANKTPIREIVGEDPVEFIEAFVRNYPIGAWRLREQRRLIDAIDRAAGGEQSGG